MACGIIPVFCKWIRPGVHGELPFSRVCIPLSLHQIRSGIYRILLTLPIKKAQIKEGRIGELILKLWRNPKENEENRTILHQIIEKWLRLVTGMSADFNEEGNEGLEEAKSQGHGRREGRRFCQPDRTWNLRFFEAAG